MRKRLTVTENTLYRRCRWPAVLALCLAVAPLQANEPAEPTLVFAASPRETPEEGREVYQPILDYLSKAIGKKIVYRHPGTWGVYRTEMVRGAYDLMFDGPHFNGYRAEKLNHNVLVKLPDVFEWVVITKKDEKFTDVSQMAGRTFCAFPPPSLGTLLLLDQFKNPSRQPLIVITKGWSETYNEVASGRCVGGVLPFANLKKIDSNDLMKIIYKSAPTPNQAVSAGPRISLQDQERIVAALTAPEAAAPTAKLRATYKSGQSFVAAKNQEFRGLAALLRNEWGYY